MPDDPKYNELDLSCLDRSEVKKMSSRERNWCPQIEANRWWTEWEWWSGVKPRNPGLDSGSENPGSSGEHGPGDDPTGRRLNGIRAARVLSVRLLTPGSTLSGVF